MTQTYIKQEQTFVTNTFRKKLFKTMVASASAGLLLTLSGCAVSPWFNKPSTALPKTFETEWKVQSKNLRYAAKHPVNQWWKHLEDSALDQLIDEAVSSNLDLKIAQAEIDFFTAQRGIRNSALFPSLDANVQAGQRREFSQTQDNFSTTFDVSWEIDVFGRLRKLKQGAINDLASNVETRRDIQVLIISNVASSYIDIRSLEQRLAIAKRNVGSQEETIKIIRARLEHGIVSELDLVRALADLDQVKASIPLLYSQLQSTKNRLNTLLGLTPGTLDKRLNTETSTKIPVPPQELIVGLPNDLIRSRPDIRSSEYLIAAESARLGASIAALYPSLSLNGNFGYSAPSVSELGDDLSEISSAGVGLRLPLFNAGRLRNSVKAQRNRQQQAVWQYERTVLNALEETSSALTSFDENHKRVEHLASASKHAHSASRLARLRYESGVSDLLEVLDAQRVELAADDAYAQAMQSKANAFVSLYKAFGGGWQFASNQKEVKPIIEK